MDAAIEIDRPTLPDVTFTRLFHAPRELVWKAWTDPMQLAAWWGPHGFSNPRCEIDARAGGLVRIDMQSSDGTVHPMDGRFLAFDAPSRLVLTTIVMNTSGDLLVETVDELDLSCEGGRTRMALRIRMLRAAPGMLPHLERIERGWGQSLERLGAILKAI